METFTSSDLKSLADLLNLSNNDMDSEDESYEFSSSIGNSNPHHLAYDLNASQKNIECKQSYKVIKQTKNIWSDEEVIDEEEDEVKTKDKPEYEMIYQQNVSPDDVFLQISGKGPGSDSCECMLVRIKLPGIHSNDEVSLDISALKLICKTERHYLNLDLPKPVDPVKCQAKWDKLQNLLVVKLLFDINCELNI